MRFLLLGASGDTFRFPIVVGKRQIAHPHA